MKKNKSKTDLSPAQVGKKISDLGSSILTTRVASSSSEFDAFMFMVTLSSGIETLLKDAEAYVKNPSIGKFVDIKTSAEVLVKHLRVEKFVKGVK